MTAHSPSSPSEQHINPTAPPQVILLHYMGATGSLGESVHRLLEKQHTVIATGPDGSPDALDPHASIEDLLQSVMAPSDRFLYLYIDSPGLTPPAGLSGIEMARVAWFTGRCHTPEAYTAFAKAFHLVFLTQRSLAERFTNLGMRNAGWLPPGAHAEALKIPTTPRDLEVACILPSSSGDTPRIQKIREELDSHFSTRYLGVFDDPGIRADTFGRARITVDLREEDLLTFPLFDALASGSLLVTPTADGLGELAMAGRHYIEAASLEDIPTLVDRYLQDTAEGEKVAQAGAALARERHTLALRVERLILLTLESLGRLGGTSGESRFRFGGYYSGPRMDLLPYIPSWARRHLDVGCGTGELCRILKERGMETTVGIEYVEQAADIARSNVDHVLQGDVEQMDIPYPPGYFDCITCGDVLEHLRDPWATLKRFADLLVPGGRVVISIPNIGFFDVIRSLTHGMWQYADQGILDRTHLRFFTGHGVEEMVRGTGLQLVTLQPLTSAPPEMLPRDAEGYVHLPKLRIGPLSDAEYNHLCTYQFLAIGEKPAGDLLKAAESALQQQDYQQAWNLATRAKGADPGRLARVQGKALARMGMMTKAIELLENALQQLPHDRMLRLETALVFLAADRAADALPLVEEVLRHEPENDRAHGALGLCALVAHNMESALASFQRALELQFDNPAILNHLLDTARTCDQLPAAEPAWRRYVEFFPGKLDMGYTYARLLADLGRTNEARERIDTILLFNPEHEAARTMLTELEGKTT